MSTDKLDRMIRNPEKELVPIFAGQRIRTAEIVIELFDRKPIRVCRQTFSIFQFDNQGRLDVGKYDKHQTALVNVSLDPVFGNKTSDLNVLDATDKFVAKGGSWSPNILLKSQLENVALGLASCSSL
jgi:hypothetical protein